MIFKFLPLFEESLNELSRADQEKFSHVIQKIEVCETFDEVYRLFSPVVAKLKDMKVYMIRVSPRLRATFTINDGIIYFVSLVDKQD